MSRAVEMRLLDFEETQQKLQSEVARLSAAQDDAEIVNRQIKADLDEAHSEIRQLKADRDHAKTEVHHLKAELDKAQSEIRRLKADRDTDQAEIAQLKSDVEEAQADILQLKTDRDEARSDIRSLQIGEGGHHDAGSSQMKSELDGAKTQIHELKIQSIAAGGDLDKLRKQQRETKEEAEKLTVQLPYLNRHVKDFFQDLQAAAEKQLKQLSKEDCPLRFEVEVEAKETREAETQKAETPPAASQEDPKSRCGI